MESAFKVIVANQFSQEIIVMKLEKILEAHGGGEIILERRIRARDRSEASRLEYKGRQLERMEESQRTPARPAKARKSK